VVSDERAEFSLQEKGSLLFRKASRLNIQDDSKGKVNILGGDSVSHCEKKSLYEHVSNSDWLLR
jgi:hypothetical protein